jgi:hypothetical protein
MTELKSWSVSALDKDSSESTSVPSSGKQDGGKASSNNNKQLMQLNQAAKQACLALALAHLDPDLL